MAFISRPGGGRLQDLFFTEYELIDQFVGKQLWLWGYGSLFNLGDTTTTDRSSPVQTVAGGNDWKQVSVASDGNHTAAIKTDGTLWLWGINTNGQLGDNTTANKSSPVQTITGGNDWVDVACGNSSTSATKTDGTLWSWGRNTSGELGDETTAHKSSPVQTIAGGTNWKQVTRGHYFGLALKTDGTLWGCGYNQWGQLGDETIAHKSSPVQTVAGGTNWKQVSTEYGFTTAIKTDGTLWTWGYNLYGQLGDNTTANKSSPVQTVAGGTNWKQVACGRDHFTAIKLDGTLWACGNDNYGQLGDNQGGTGTNKSSPVQTIAGGNDWKQVAAAEAHTVAIKTNGTLWTWGRNTNGQLGDETVVHKSSPVQTVAGGSDWLSGSAGKNTTAGTKYTG